MGTSQSPYGRRRRYRLARFVFSSGLGGLLLATLLLPFVVGAAWVTKTATDVFESLPVELHTPPAPERSRVVAADGSTLATFYAQNRIEVPLKNVAPVLRDAIVAIEDARFYQHGPIDPKSIVRALVENLKQGGVAQGASTLTQQYVKNVLVIQAGNDDEKVREATEPTIRRKLQEMRYAVSVEKKLSKNQILERYLNIAYFGAGAYGIEAAARRYFSKPAAKLDLHEAALLAGLVKEPGAYDPLRDEAAAKNRRDVVLDRMAETGFLSAPDAERAKASKLGLKPTDPRNGCDESPYPFFCDYVVSLVRNDKAFGTTRMQRMRRLHEGGLTIRTTLDPKVQRAAQRAVDGNIEKTNDVATAIAIVEPGTGEVKAIALNRDYGKGRGRTQVNYALDKAHGGSSGFQAGSAFKPFVLAAALKQGIQPSLELEANRRVTVSGFRNCATGAVFPPYTVSNYDNNDYGRIDMRQATWRSVNAYYVQLERRTGLCEPVRLAEAMGLRRADGESLQRYPSFVLGAEEVAPLGMAEAFATFAAGGEHCRAHGIVSVTDRTGKKMDLPGRSCTRVLDRKTASDVTSILRGVIDGDDPQRTGARMSLGRPAAGKTGTTSGNVAVWFVGYTDELAAAVWSGYPDGSRPLTNVTVRGQFYDRLFGSRLPGPIWRDAMRAALD
jgi:membrane peptidoglycan carboxypeptidase